MPRPFLLISTGEHGSHCAWLAVEYVLRLYKTNLLMSSQLTLVTYDSCFWRKPQDVRCSGFQRESRIPEGERILSVAGYLSSSTLARCLRYPVHITRSTLGTNIQDAGLLGAICNPPPGQHPCCHRNGRSKPGKLYSFECETPPMHLHS